MKKQRKDGRTTFTKGAFGKPKWLREKPFPKIKQAVVTQRKDESNKFMTTLKKLFRVDDSKRKNLKKGFKK